MSDEITTLPPLTWKTEVRKLGDLVKWDKNPRQLSRDQAKRLRESIEEFGYSQLYEIEPDNTILDGHQRDEVMLRMQDFGATANIEVRVASRKLTLDERKKYIAMKHKGATGDWDWDVMQELYDFGELVQYGFEDTELLEHGFRAEDDPFAEDEMQEILDAETDDEIPEMELQPYESYDYLVLVFKDRYNWLRAVDLLGIQKSKVTLSNDVQKTGIGRAIAGERVLDLIDGGVDDSDD